MRPPSNQLVEELKRAADTDDDQVFEMAFGQLLERARAEANPGARLRALIDERLQGELAVPSGSPGAKTSGGVTLAATLGSGVRRIAAHPGRLVRFARGLSLVAVGVAIGFVWGRAPRSWPSDIVTHPGVTGVSELGPRALVEPAPRERSGLEPAVSSDSSRAVAPASPEKAGPVVEGEVEHDHDARSKPSAAAVAAKGKPLAAHDTRAPSAGADSLRFVLEQLRKAQLSLRAGDPAQALAALDLLDARVSASVLQEEREVTRTLALCDSGETAEAAALAERVLTRSPDSAYTVSLRESCAGKAKLLEEIRERTSNPPR
jgi:hypothetical protein